MTATLSYCVKHSRLLKPWRGPIPWDRPEPRIKDTITLDGNVYRVLDVGVIDTWMGRDQRHISVYVTRQVLT